MKFLLIISLSLLSLNMKAQVNPVTDTLAYLQTVIANKAQFIGQPFSKLSDSLRIQIKFFSPSGDIPYDRRKETSTRFGFCFPAIADEIYLTYPSVRVIWQSPLNAVQSDIIYDNNNGGGWNATSSAFYSTGIIRDIQLVE